MRSNFIFPSILVISVCLSACGSKQEENKKTANSSAANSIGNTVSNSGAATPAASGGTPIPGIEGPVAASNVDINEPAAGDIETRKRREIIDNPDGKLQPPTPVDAGENSTITTIMDKSGVATETRVFKSDPQIAKVQKVISTNGTTVKIFLKNGKVVSVGADRLPIISYATLATLKELAGIKPPPPPVGNDTKSQENMKKKQQP